MRPWIFAAAVIILASMAWGAEPPATQPGTGPAVRTDEQVKADMQAADQRIMQAASSVDVMVDPDNRARLAPKVMAAMKTMVACADEMIAKYPDRSAELTMGKAPYQTLLAYFGDAQTTGALESAAKDAARATALPAKAMLLVAKWWQSSNDAAAQGKILDDVEALMKANMEDESVAPALANTMRLLGEHPGHVANAELASRLQKMFSNDAPAGP